MEWCYENPEVQESLKIPDGLIGISPEPLMYFSNNQSTFAYRNLPETQIKETHQVPLEFLELPPAAVAPSDKESVLIPIACASH
jgi:hypothetical protein